MNAWRGWTLLAVAMMAGCGPDAEEAPRPEVVIGVIAPLSGDFNSAGTETVHGVELALREIEEAGGLTVGGRPLDIRLVIENDESRTDVTVTKAIKLIDTDRAVALIGMPISREAIAAGNVAESRRVPMLTTKATHADVTAGREYAFRMMYTDDHQGRVLADFVANGLGSKKVALLADAGSAYSLGLADVFRSALAEQGGGLVFDDTVTFDESEADRAEHLRRVRESGADTLVLPVHSTLGRAYSQAIEANALDVTVVGGDSWGRLDFVPNPHRRPTYFTDVWIPSPDTDASRHFLDAFRAAYGTEPTVTAALAYDGLRMIAAAIRSEDAADAESIRRGLRSQGSFQGVTGEIRYNGASGVAGDPVRTALVVRIDKDGIRYAEKTLDETVDDTVNDTVNDKGGVVGDGG